MSATVTLLTVEEVAGALQVSTKHVRRLRRIGLLRGVNLSTSTTARGARWRYEPSELDRFIRNQHTITITGGGTDD